MNSLTPSFNIIQQNNLKLKPIWQSVLKLPYRHRLDLYDVVLIIWIREPHLYCWIIFLTFILWHRGGGDRTRVVALFVEKVQQLSRLVEAAGWRWRCLWVVLPPKSACQVFLFISDDFRSRESFLLYRWRGVEQVGVQLHQGSAAVINLKAKPSRQTGRQTGRRAEVWDSRANGEEKPC